jgi:S-adenosylmethionine:tRNA ribosyltransferase-isomerase
MRVDLFDFHLPPELIALRPAEPRDAARLMVVRPRGGREDRIVSDLPGLLAPGDALVFNDTKVIPAELHGVRHRGESRASITFTLHKREGADQWRAFARPGKRLKTGDRIDFSTPDGGAAVWASVIERGEEGEVLIGFDLKGPDLDAAIHAVGHLPLPPYISGRRPADERDRADYQTVYAREEGAVAAPTAGLHFTADLLARLEARGIERHFVTLHVGAGTFLPVKAEDTRDHRMHSEFGTVSATVAAALNAVRARGNKIVAVGTTSLRLLESALDADGRIAPFSGDTDIFITPGARIRSIDALMTNFHLPKSTLFMLVSAFSGFETMRAVYAHAVESGYRFYSYGDSSLLFPDFAP